MSILGGLKGLTRWMVAVLIAISTSLVSFAAGGERLPIGEFTAVRMNPAPVVDGKMTPGEWDRAFASSGLIVPFDHKLQEAETTIYMGYDDTRFYFLYKCRRGNSEWKLWKSSRNNDDYDFGEPTVELWITPPTLVPETYQNIINTYPAVFDEKFIPSRGYASLGWKANWTLGVSEDDLSYIVEASVLIKDFGFDKVKDGDSWNFLFCRNAPGTLPRSQASWSITQGFSEIPQHPKITFADKSPVVQLLGVVSVLSGNYNFPMAVIAPKDAGADVDVSLRFMQGKTISDADIITTKAINLKAGERQEFAFTGNTPEGWKTGNFCITAKTRDGQMLFSQYFPFNVSGFVPLPPVKPEKAQSVQDLYLKAMYGPESNWLMVKADIFDFAKRGDVAGGTVKIIDAVTNKVIKTAEVGAFREYYSATRISLDGEQIPVKDFKAIAYQKKQIENIKDDNIQLAKQGKPLKNVPEIKETPARMVKVEVSLRDKDGNAMVQSSTDLSLLRYNMTWMNNNIGITDKVISPWTPVKVEKDKIGVWNRSMNLNGLGLARSITNGKTEQMKSAMRLIAVINGEEKEVAASVPSVTRQVDAEVEMTGTGTAPGLLFNSKSKVEFDGFSLVNLTIAPDGAKTKVDRLTLEITIPEEEATHFCTTAGGWAAVHDETPAYWSSLQTASGTLVNDFVPYIWLTNGERGFMWFADNDKGWITEADKTHPSQEFVKKDGKVTLKINFIEVPTELSSATTVTFGYQAFPSRPLPEGYRATFVASSAPIPDTKATVFWFDGDWAVLWPYYCSPFPWSYDKSRDLFENTPKNSTHHPAVGSIAHSIGRYLDAERNDFSALAADWGQTPGQIGNSDVTQSKGPVDFRVFHYQKWVKESSFRALYIDENYLATEDNWLTGNAYYRADGRLQQGYSYLGLREYYKRMMIMFNENGVSRPNLWMHITSGAAYNAWFGDVFIEGENVEPTDLNFDYIEVLPAGRLRSIASSVCSGGVMNMMCQAMRHPTKWVNKHVHQFTGWVMAHDINAEQVGYFPVLVQESRLYEKDVTFIGYWKKENPCKTTTPNCVVSVHKTDGRALLTVVNIARTDQAVDVSVNFAGLGFDPAKVILVNGETGELIPFTKTGFKVNVLQRDFVPVQVIERKLLKNKETFFATFDNGTRADEAFGSNVLQLQRSSANEQMALCTGVNGKAVNSSKGIMFWARMHLSNTSGRVTFQGLLNNNTNGTIINVGPLKLNQKIGKTAGISLEYKANKDSKLEIAESAALTAGWHLFDLAWADGKAVLTVDGKQLATIAIASLGIGQNFDNPNGVDKSVGSTVYLGDNRGILQAIDDLKCSLE